MKPENGTENVFLTLISLGNVFNSNFLNPSPQECFLSEVLQMFPGPHTSDGGRGVAVATLNVRKN